jgi:DNA-binding CsgD family transcriptional regulator/tetratricopeptide (TPR) repeat protein
VSLLERETLLQGLGTLLRGVAGGRGHVALVAGEAGIGKSSLARALADQAGDAEVWWGACDALETPHPLLPLQDIARSSDVGFGHLLAAGERARLFEAVLSELSATRRPKLVVIEDAHWADEATLDLLKFVGRRIAHAPCLLVVTYRDDEIDAAHPLRRLTSQMPTEGSSRFELPRLSPSAVAQLARRAFRAAEGVHEITQGNPFFVSELLRNESFDVPRGVQDLVLSRLSRLSPPAQEIVRLSSIVPKRIERWLVEVLCSPSLDALEEALDSGLLLAQGQDLAFRHELARVAVEVSLSSALAPSLHARVLGALERQGAPESSLARRVHHAVRAGNAAAVRRLAPEAARQAQQRGAHKEAAAQWRTALAHSDGQPLAERAQMFDALSYESYLIDRGEDALSASAQARALWQALGEVLREGDALRWMSRLSWYNGRSAQAEGHADRAIELLSGLPPGRELAMAWSNRAQLHMLAGRAQEAREWSRKALQLAQELGECALDIQAHALNNLGTALLNDGDESGRAHLERSLELALAANHSEHAARAYTNLSHHAVVSRDLANAFALQERGLAYCEERDLDAWTRYMAGYRAEALLAAGRWTEAGEQAQAVLRAPYVAPISRVPTLLVLAQLRTRRGDPDAQELLDEALSLALPTESLMRIGPVAAARAEAAWLDEDVARARQEAQRAAPLALHGRYLRLIAGEVAYWLHRTGALEQFPEACPAPYLLQFEGRWREAAREWEKLGCPYERARALADGDVEGQREALEIFDSLGARVDAERLRRALQAAGVRGLKRGQRPSTQANPHSLTTRELEILRLLCAGLRNAQIAERLHRSVRTIDHHVAAVFAKLGVATRAEAIAAAHAAGLATPAAAK